MGMGIPDVRHGSIVEKPPWDLDLVPTKRGKELSSSYKMSRQRRAEEQLRHHYDAEKKIADRLRHSTREQRIAIMKTMYDELFAQVRHHPRLMDCRSVQSDHVKVRRQIGLLKRFLAPEHTYLEFGPGNCHLAITVCSMVRTVYAVDISDEVDPNVERPRNLNFIVYDGFNLDLADNSVDVAFSDQMVEHLHPDDTPDHFRLVHRLLRPNGIYVLRTPHKLYGPHDISRHFSDVPEGFHLQEWSFAELGRLVESVGFSRWQGRWCARGFCWWMPKWLLLSLERVISLWPVEIRRRLGFYFLPSVTMIAQK